MPVPNPIYEPVWNLIPPPVPAVNDTGYVKSLDEMKVKTSKVYENIKTETEALRKRKAELWGGGMRKDTEEETGKLILALQGGLGQRERKITKLIKVTWGGYISSNSSSYSS